MERREPGERWVVSGFEGDLAVLELPGGRTLDLPRAWLPEGAREGSHLRVAAEAGRVTIALDPEATRAAVRELEALRAELRARARDDGGDLEL